MAGGAAIKVPSKHAGIEVVVIDIGVKGAFDKCSGLVEKKIAAGTRNRAQGPAMTRQRAEDAIHTGIELAKGAAKNEIDLIVTGNMRIGNHGYLLKPFT